DESDAPGLDARQIRALRATPRQQDDDRSCDDDWSTDPHHQPTDVHQTSPSVSRCMRAPTVKTVPPSAATKATTMNGIRSTERMTLLNVRSEIIAKAPFAPMFPKNGTSAKPMSAVRPAVVTSPVL